MVRCDRGNGAWRKPRKRAAAKFCGQVEPLPLFANAQVGLGQQLRARDVLLLDGLFRNDLRDLRRRVLLDRQVDGLLQRQPHHSGRPLLWQTVLLVRLRSSDRWAQQQPEKQRIENDVRALGSIARLAFAAVGSLLTTLGPDFTNDRLIQTSLSHQMSSLVMNLLQKCFPRWIDEAHSAQIDRHLFVVGASVAPRLLQGSDPRSGKPAFDGQYDLPLFLFSSDSQH